MELKDRSLQAIVTRIVTHGAARDVMANEIIELARILDDERDARRAMGSLAEHRDNRLQGEIAERSQRQLEITGRLADLERRIAQREKLTELTRLTEEAGGYAEPVPPPVIPESRLTDVEAYRQRWERQVSTISEIRARLALARDERHTTEMRNRDLETKIAAQQKEIDAVWALVEMTDGYGSPFWAEPGLDDTTPAQAVGAVLEHLRAQLAEHEAEGVERRRDYTEELTEAIGYMPGSLTWSRALELVHANLKRLEKLRFGPSCHFEAMAALNAADRQADDDQICGC